jgi:hypothetical protein
VAGAEVAGGADGPGFEVAHGGSDDGDEEADHEGSGVGTGGLLVVLLVVLLGDGEDAEDEEGGEDDFVEEGVGGVMARSVWVKKTPAARVRWAARDR